MGREPGSRGACGGLGRREFLAGAAACGGALFFGGAGRLRAAPLQDERPGSLFHVRVCPDGRLVGTATHGDGSSALELFTLGPDGQPVHALSFESTGTGPLAFNFPQGLCFDDRRRLLVVDANNGRVQVLEAGAPPGAPFTFHRELLRLGPKPGECHTPGGVAFANGALFLADTRNHRVQILDAESGAVRLVLGERGTGLGQFRLPSDVAVDEEGTLFVADSGNGRIQLVSGWRAGTPAFACPEPFRGFGAPVSALAAAAGILYAMECPAAAGRPSKLRAFRRDGTQWVRDGREEHLNGRLSGLGKPYGLCLGVAGEIYVADREPARTERGFEFRVVRL